MNDGLKQRIIGAVVLMVLALIFLPMVFNFKGIRDIDRASRIPSRPQIEPVTVPEPVRPEITEASRLPDEAYQFDKSRTEQEQGEPEDSQLASESVLNDRGLPSGWVIQVGSFSEEDKAKGLESKLLKDNFRAYVREAESQGRSLYRVYVGPNIDKQHALADQKKINEKYNVKSLLLKFEA